MAVKASISFGLVYIPVSLHVAVRSNGVDFRLLDKKTMSKVRYLKTCDECDGRTVEQKDIVKAYEYEKGKFVVFSDEDFEKLKTPKDKTITIEKFVGLEEIDPIYFDKPYYVAPEGADKAYAVLVAAMEKEKKATRQSYGEALLEVGKENADVVVLDADLSSATKTNIFAKELPERFFDIGIAEANMMGTAAGLATCGKIPYASTFAVFAAGRAYDQIRNSICYPNLNVKICATHAGITVGEDGATHQMLEDISMMRTLPNMIVMSTSDDIQTKWAVKEISKINGPVYLRLSRMKTSQIYNENQKFEIGKAVQIGEGTDGTIFATGVTVEQAIKAQEELKKQNIEVRVVDIHTIKPIDKEMIVKCAKETEKLMSIEDHSVIGGLGSAISEVLTEEYPVRLDRMGIKDTFGKSGKAEELMEYFEITAKDIVKKF